MIDDALTKYLKELDNDAIFANLDMALGGKPSITSSPTKAMSAKSGAKLVNIPIINILADCYEIIKGKDPYTLGTDEDCIG